MHVTALAGGVGGSKLLIGLQNELDAGELTAIVNVADDATIYGLHISPDLDIVTYWLSDLADTERGWGIKDDTFTVVDALASLHGESWFRLGDRDLATCLFRTERLARGATLSEVTDAVRTALGVPTRIVPATDDSVRTLIETEDERTLDFQVYFVKKRQQPVVKAVHLSGIDDAKPAPGVVDAIVQADRVIVCPSNPVVSIGPILAINGVRDALRAHDDVVAVSPIVAGRAVKGPADKMLPTVGAEVSARGVSSLYSDFCNTFVVDRADVSDVASISDLGPACVALDTMMVDRDSSNSLARALLEL